MSPHSSTNQEAAHWIEVVQAKVAAIRFGSVHVTVHEGRVTQVEAVEKTRIDPPKPDAAPPAKP